MTLKQYHANQRTILEASATNVIDAQEMQRLLYNLKLHYVQSRDIRERLATLRRQLVTQ